MSISFAALKTRLNGSVLRADLAASLGDFINEALREIQNRRSWTCMKKNVNVSIAPGAITDEGPDLEGSQTVALPADFKELQKRPAVHYIADDGGFIPADLVTEEEQIHRIWAFGGTPMQTWPPRVFLNLNGNDNVLGIIEPLSQALNFRVKYYAFLPDLSADADTSPLANSWPKMVLAKAKAIAFSEINDDIWEKAESEFEKKLTEAIRQEAHAEVQGRETRM